MDILSISLFTKGLALVVVALWPVSITTNSGETIEGNLTGFSGDAIQFDAAGQTRELSYDELASLSPSSVKPGTGPTYRVTLAGGSRIAAQDLRLADNELMIEPRRQDPLRVPIHQVKAIRFRAGNTSTDPKWLGIMTQQNRGDQLVIRRDEDRLDPLSGIVAGIADGKVAFDLDGDQVDAPIEKLEGLVFGATQSDSVAANIRVTDVYGSQWQVQSIEPSQAGEPLKIRISDSLTHALPLDHIKSIRWSGGLVLLAQQSAAKNTTEPYFQTKLDAGLINKFFAANPVRGEDLIAHGGSVIEYRVDPGYETCAGTIHRLGTVRHGSSMKVMIKLDDEILWEEELIDAQPRGFELPIGNSRRVTFIVDDGSDGNLGDTVRIVRPRLSK